MLSYYYVLKEMAICSPNFVQVGKGRDIEMRKLFSDQKLSPMRTKFWEHNYFAKTALF